MLKKRFVLPLLTLLVSIFLFTLIVYIFNVNFIGYDYFNIFLILFSSYIIVILYLNLKFNNYILFSIIIVISFILYLISELNILFRVSIPILILILSISIKLWHKYFLRFRKNWFYIAGLLDFIITSALIIFIVNKIFIHQEPFYFIELIKFQIIIGFSVYSVKYFSRNMIL